MPDYYLPRHVYFCCRGGSMVFLDLHQDDYLLINGESARLLEALIADGRTTTQPERCPALNELLDGGLLTADSRDTKPILPTRLTPALERLIDPEEIPAIRPTVAHLWRFISACITAAVRLRFGKLENTVAMVARRKATSQLATVEVNRARELTAVFSNVRSFFPRNYLCLYDSLALIEFLARYEIFPTWVFGVTLEPWAAHCWVQEGKHIFNEDVEMAAGYTPVMVI